MKLLSISGDAKTVKGEAHGYQTAIMYLAPANESGVANLCPSSSPGCRAACLFTAGHGRFDNVRNARVDKTKYLYNDRKAFMAQLNDEIEKFEKSAHKKGFIPVIRLNGTSDLPWESKALTGGIMETWKHLQFYDYTKIFNRALKWAKGEMPSNYHLTFSYTEEQKNHDWAEQVAQAGGNIAVVFRKPEFPETFLTLPVINGDAHDLRFTDPKGSIVGLKAKGDAKKDKLGFVVDVI